MPLGKGWSLVGYSDVGGFNVNSRLTWQWFVGVNYQFNKYLVVKAGYRYLYTDYDQDDYLYDMTVAGPYLGLGIVFLQGRAPFGAIFVVRISSPLCPSQGSRF